MECVSSGKKTIYVDLIMALYKLGLLTKDQLYEVGLEVAFDIERLLD